MNRRQLLRGGASVAGLMVTGTLAGCGEPQGRETSPELAARIAGLQTGDALREPGSFFTRAEFRMLQRICDLMIPETDTPGALAAGVPTRINRMMVAWALPETSAQWREGLAAFNDYAMSETGQAFLDLDEAAQFDCLERYDRQALSGGGNARYRRMKAMIVDAYYSSEPGATQELIYLPNPGEYRGCIDFASVGRTWAI